MKCPKCKASIGVHLTEFALMTHSDAYGMRCFICGFWMNVIPKRNPAVCREG